MKHVTEQMKCGKELSNTTVCLDFLRRLSCVDIVCLCKTWPNKTNLIQLYKQTHLFVNMFQWCLSLQPIWSEPSASFTMSDEGAKASEVGKQHLFKWCIVVMHTARLPLKSQMIFLNKFSGNQAVPHRDETQSLILSWVLSLLCARLECTPDVWYIKIHWNFDATSKTGRNAHVKRTSAMLLLIANGSCPFKVKSYPLQNIYLSQTLRWISLLTPLQCTLLSW